jgi:superfamily II DNA helicase RecQ
MTLLKSDAYKKLSSILLYATKRATVDQIAAFLGQQGIPAASYHAGKTEEQRTFIQK